jgi:hypothetical protein
MKRIPLTQGQFALVDDEDFERLIKHKWYAKWNNNTKSFYAARHLSRREDGRTDTIRMHREITGAVKTQIVDHVNHNTLDNRRSNIRICSMAESSSHRRVQSNNKSGFKGVTRIASSQKWRAYIRTHLVQVHLGNFQNPEDAAAAYDAASLRYHGKEWGVTNAALGLVTRLDRA